MDTDSGTIIAHEWLARLTDTPSWANELTVRRLGDALRDPGMRDMMALSLMDPTLDAGELAERARNGMSGPGMLAVRPDRSRLVAARRELTAMGERDPECMPAVAMLCTLIFWLAGDRKGLDEMLSRPIPDDACRIVTRWARDHGLWPAGVIAPREYKVPAI